MVAEWSKLPCFQIQVETDVQVPDLNPAQDIDSSELEINCRYSNSKVPGDLWLLTKLNRVALHWKYIKSLTG